MNRILAKTLFLLASTAGATSLGAAQVRETPSGVPCTPPGWLHTFGGSAGTNDDVYALAVHDDGSGPGLFAAGAFTAAGGFGERGVARWDGSSWALLGDGLQGSIFVLGDMLALTTFDPGSGAVLVAGGQGYVEQWDGAGWQILGALPNREVHSLVAHDDGSGARLFAAGRFGSVDGVAALNIAGWNGTSWAPLGSGLSGGVGLVGVVNALAVFDAGSGPELYVGGDFTLAGGVAVSNLASWNGTAWAAVPDGPNGEVKALAVHDDGSGPALFATGLFSAVGGLPVANIARWNGTSWSALGNGLNGLGYALAVHDAGAGPELLAGGLFTQAGGGAAARVARWDGSLWAPLGSGVSASCRALASFDGGGGAQAVAGGSFTTAGPTTVNHVARFDGASWGTLGSEAHLGNAVEALAVHDDGGGLALYAGGGFTTAGSVSASRIARWDGTDWHALGSGVNNTVNALTMLDAGGGPELFVGGLFTTAGGASANRVARWDGGAWHGLGSGTNSAVNALCVFDDGDGPALYAGGAFTTAGGSPASRVARWNGSSWLPLAGGVNDSVWALAVFDDGQGPALYAGGDFSSAGGVSASHVARWDGSSWQALGSGISTLYTVRDLAVYDDGSGPALHACGEFTSAGGLPAKNIARWDGSAWSPLGAGRDFTVYSMAVFDDGSGSGPQLCVGGLGNPLSPLTNRMARWDGAGWSSFGSLMDDQVSVLAVFDDGSGAGPALYAGGRFAGSNAGDSALARWQGCPDASAPVLDCPAAVGKSEALGSPPGEFVRFTVTAQDRDPFATVVCTPPSGSFFSSGTTLVSCTATDASGNQSTCQFPVTVLPKLRRR